MLFGPYGSGCHICVLALSVLAALALSAARLDADPQSNQFIMINEIYTNADGTKQFIELIARADGQTNLAPTYVAGINFNATDTNLAHDFTTSFPQLGNNETVLLATQAVVNELGFNADRIIPNNSIFLSNGKIIFALDGGTANDAVAYGNYTGSNTGFGSPAPALPMDGSLSLQRIRYSFVSQDNSTDFEYAQNSPKRNDGTSGILQGSPVAPILNPIGDQSINEGALLSFQATATDGNGTNPMLSTQSMPMGSSFTDHQTGTGTFNWTPSFTQSGIYNVLFIASDGALADSETVQITVFEVTNPPVARDSAVTKPEDLTFAAQLQAYDPDGNVLTYSILTGPFLGQAQSLNAQTGAFTYVPNPNVSGLDSISFRVNDGNVNSNTAKWRLTITPVNDPPEASTVNSSTIKNVPISLGSMPVTDIDNVSWTIIHRIGPFNGFVSNFQAQTGSFDYTPLSDYIGPDSITYIADDGVDTSAHAKIRIQVYDECGCPCPADPECDGIRSSILDVIKTIEVAFRGISGTNDPSCVRTRTDVNCTGNTDILDVVKVVEVAFRGHSASTSYCNPCAP